MANQNKATQKNQDSQFGNQQKQNNQQNYQSGNIDQQPGRNRVNDNKNINSKQSNSGR